MERDFFELVKAIGESKSKQEEDRIIAEEVSRNWRHSSRIAF
jgi:AP-4 complex subunit epsilon-1